MENTALAIIHTIAFLIILLCPFRRVDFLFHRMQQEIETINPLLILMDSPKQ